MFCDGRFDLFYFSDLIFFFFFAAQKQSTRFFKKELSDGMVSSSSRRKKWFNKEDDGENSDGKLFVEDTDSNSDDVYLPTPPLVCTPEKNEATPVRRVH